MFIICLFSAQFSFFLDRAFPSMICSRCDVLWVHAFFDLCSVILEFNSRSFAFHFLLVHMYLAFARSLHSTTASCLPAFDLFLARQPRRLFIPLQRTLIRRIRNFLHASGRRTGFRSYSSLQHLLFLGVRNSFNLGTGTTLQRLFYADCGWPLSHLGLRYSINKHIHRNRPFSILIRHSTDTRGRNVLPNRHQDRENKR